jgi:hypothetical protein
MIIAVIPNKQKAECEHRAGSVVVAFGDLRQRRGIGFGELARDSPLTDLFPVDGLRKHRAHPQRRNPEAAQDQMHYKGHDQRVQRHLGVQEGKRQQGLPQRS